MGWVKRRATQPKYQKIKYILVLCFLTSTYYLLVFIGTPVALSRQSRPTHWLVYRRLILFKFIAKFEIYRTNTVILFLLYKEINIKNFNDI
jgi:hypothetical protein